MKNNILPIALILLLSILISLPLFKPGFYTVHDDQQIARLFVFDEAFKHGQFPVRWVNGLGFGFGYPLFIFYPPLAYMIGEAFHLIGFDFISSTKLTFFSSIILSGLSIYVLAKYLWGKIEAVAAAIFYMLVPYRALDVYVRGALAESFSFVWPPLIIWAYIKLYKTENINDAILAGVFLALLMITHNLIFLPFLLILFIFLFSLIFVSKHKMIFTTKIILSLATAFCLSAFFSLPALIEKKFTIVDDILLVNLANYNIHFVYPQQLWNWTWGFGGSAPGLADGISFKIGKLNVIVAIGMFIWSIFYLLSKKIWRINYFTNYLILVFFTLFVFSAFMTTYYSKFIWDNIKPLGYLQFPWRFLTFTALFSSLLTGAFIYNLRISILKIIFLTIFTVSLLITNLKLFKPQYYRTNLTDQIATSKDVISWDVSFSSFEYMPKGVPLIRNSLGANAIDINKSEIPSNKLEITEGTGNIDLTENTPASIKFSQNNRTDTLVKANIYDFPNWKVYIDGKTIEHKNNNKFNLISFKVPNGTHRVEIKFQNTPLRNISNSISTIMVIVLIIYITINVRRHRVTIRS